MTKKTLPLFLISIFCPRTDHWSVTSKAVKLQQFLPGESLLPWQWSDRLKVLWGRGVKGGQTNFAAFLKVFKSFMRPGVEGGQTNFILYTLYFKSFMRPGGRGRANKLYTLLLYTLYFILYTLKVLWEGWREGKQTLPHSEGIYTEVREGEAFTSRANYPSSSPPGNLQRSTTWMKWASLLCVWGQRVWPQGPRGPPTLLQI